MTVKSDHYHLILGSQTSAKEDGMLFPKTITLKTD